MIARLHLSVIAVVPSLVLGHLAAQSCLPYEPQVVTLKGTLTVGAFPGRPNYEDTLQGDQPEHPFILKLDAAICVEPDSLSQLYNDPQVGIREIQLAVVGDSLLLKVRRLVGHRIAVTGQLFSAETGHHHAPVLIFLRDLRAA
jgi:Domain of unknown function (DUF4431)